ncbi:MAG: fatty acid desaturase [Planctomycetes bacterium]|nr:fatty acid desaturase [Planctomycetota bacterium]
MTIPTPKPEMADLHAAHEIVRDLFTPTPWRYWRELAIVGTIGWATYLLAAAQPGPTLFAVAMVCLAVPFWFRLGVMVHELTHQRRDEIPGFHFAWNLIVGIFWILPSVGYEGAHNGHHRRSTYGTVDDPEYLQLAGRPWAIIGYILFAFVAFPIVFTRFTIGTPISWFFPPLRRFLVRYASSYVINLAYARTMNRVEYRRLVFMEIVMLLAYWPPIVLSILGEISWQWLVCWYAIYTTSLFINRFRMLSAHHFESDGTPTDHFGQFRDSINNPIGWTGELWAPLGLRYHALHHLFPTIPYHNMREAYQRLAAKLPPESFFHSAVGGGLWRSVGGLFVRRSHRLQ